MNQSKQFVSEMPHRLVGRNNLKPYRVLLVRAFLPPDFSRNADLNPNMPARIHRVHADSQMFLFKLARIFFAQEAACNGIIVIRVKREGLYLARKLFQFLNSKVCTAFAPEPV